MTVACLILTCVPYLIVACSVKVDMQDNLRLVHQQNVPGPRESHGQINLCLQMCYITYPVTRANRQDLKSTGICHTHKTDNDVTLQTHAGMPAMVQLGSLSNALSATTTIRPVMAEHALKGTVVQRPVHKGGRA